jgi:hypothetical protein
VQLKSLLRDRVQLALLGQQRGSTAVQLPSLALELRQGDDLRQVGVQQPLLLALQLAQRLADGRLPGLKLLGQPRPTPRSLQRVGDLRRVGKQRAQVGPDQLVQLSGGDVAGGAALPLRRPQRVGSSAALVVAVTGLDLADGATTVGTCRS